MKRSKRLVLLGGLGVVLAIGVAGLAVRCACVTNSPYSKVPSSGPYELTATTLTQPLDHTRPDAGALEQEVYILAPEGASLSSPVFYILGNEADTTSDTLVRWYNTYGAPRDVIFVIAEHRGYGQSLSPDADQSVPQYVRIEQALADFHAVAVHLQQRYSGPWMAAGYSYGGGLVIDYAAKYPEDVRVVLSSSGVIDWPFEMDAYDRQVRSTFGESAYRRLITHAKNLQPVQLFDQNWLDREFLVAIVHGLTQVRGFKAGCFLPLFRLPTRLLIGTLHAVDQMLADGEAWRYAASNAKRTLRREEALGKTYSWRVWRYQQCTETGVFEISAASGGMFTRTRADFVEECEALFGEKPRALERPWSPRQRIRELSVPFIYVGGGIDPWAGLGLEPDDPIENGRYFFVAQGAHVPERDDPALAREVLAEMLRRATGA